MVMTAFTSRRSDDDPVQLIRAKIAERRIFEARFLFRQFANEIPTGEKMQLAEQLGGLLSRADHLLQRARSHAAGGEREQAARLYREIEGLVIDMPGVAEEVKALADATALMEKIGARPVEAPDAEEPPEQSEPMQPAEAEAKQGNGQPAVEPPSRWTGRIWLAALAIGLVAVGLLAWVVWRDAGRGPTIVTQDPSSGQHILIRPLVTDKPAATESSSLQQSPAAIDQDSGKATATTDSPPATTNEPPKPPAAAKDEDAPLPALKLGTLRIEPSGKR